MPDDEVHGYNVVVGDESGVEVGQVSVDEGQRDSLFPQF